MAEEKRKLVQRLAPWLVLSIVVALVAFLSGILAFGSVLPPHIFGLADRILGVVALTSALIWFLLFAVSALYLRWRALWLLIGSPIVLCVPVFIVAFSWSLANGINTCVAHNTPADVKLFCYP